MQTTATAAILAWLAIAASPAAAQIPYNIDLAAERAAIEKYQDIDQRLQNAGWRLARGNAEFCARTTPSVGLQLHDLASYGEPAIARAALGMDGSFAVQTVAGLSPAGRAGMFARNREITLIDDDNPNSWSAAERFYWKRLLRAHERIDETLRTKGSITFGFADGTTATLAPVSVCTTRFELADSGDLAVADGDRVVFGADFPGFAYEDAVFAGGVAHELAHNLLGHTAWLDRHGRKRRNVRRTEREADRLMPWLLANAGYDPENAALFMQTWGPKHDGGLFRRRTHDGWDERVEFINSELPLIRELMAATGKADWTTHFERTIEPEPNSRSAKND